MIIIQQVASTYEFLDENVDERVINKKEEKDDVMIQWIRNIWMLMGKICRNT